jgi:Kef-type K+ transport system membrane component KefB
MVFVGRPFLQRVLAPKESGRLLTKSQTAIVLASLLTSALITESIGIHALFGAFIAGTVMPRDREFRALLRDRLESVSSVFLLPLFFVYTGLRTEVGLLGDMASWATCLGIIAVATAGKLGGTAVAARWTGFRWRDSIVLGALMNSRGLMELIALNVGYDLGILTPKIFTMMVLMALVTTAMTGPLLSLGLNWGRRRALPPQGPLPRSA